jgi:TonB dependent receptor/TonB-dependent Receptor Plug Domain/Carboxypeptidase regulatory-like domain
MLSIMPLLTTHIFFAITAIAFCALFTPVTAQEATAPNSSISGVVREAQSGELVIGASVALYAGTFTEGAAQKPVRGAYTNKYGFYALSGIPAGSYTLAVKRVGFATFTQSVSTHEASGRINVNLAVNLAPGAVRLQGVSVQAQRERGAAVSTVDVAVDFVKQIPSLGGERDIFRVLQLMPGVKTVSEISSGLYVRGGSPDQNLVLLDGVTVYNPQHLGGFLSAFNTDAVSNIRLIKGAFPAEYGGRLSSVLDLTMKEGSKEKVRGSAGISLVSMGALLEGPVSSNATFMVSARRMYFDLIAAAIDAGGRVLPRYNFYDVNAKINVRLDESNQFFLSGYFGRDLLPRINRPGDATFELGWGNATGNARWTHLFSPTLFGAFSLIYTSYDFKYAAYYAENIGGEKQFETATQIQDLTARGELQWSAAAGHTIKGGFELTRHNFVTDILSGSAILQGTGSAQQRSTDPLQRVSSAEAAAYIQDEWDVAENLTANIGARASFFERGGHFRIEPRASLAYQAAENLTFKAAYAVASQFLHLLQDNSVALPTDTWFPSTGVLKPARSTQYVLGAEAYLFDREFLLTVEGYYKWMESLYEFREDARFVPGTIAESLMTSGTGEAYGVEVFFNKQVGAFTGWLGYTLSWSTRLFSELNGGKPFFPRYDRRHDIVLAAAYKLNDRWDFGATWTYATGQALTMPDGLVDALSTPTGLTIEPALSRNLSSGQTTRHYGDRNAFRLPAYHRLDVSATHKFTWIGGLPFEFSINFYNVYNRLNPYTAWVENFDGKSRLWQLTLLPFVPTLGLVYILIMFFHYLLCFYDFPSPTSE